MKKIIFILVIFGLIQACAEEDQYWEIGDFSIDIYGDNFIPVHKDTIISNNLYLQLIFNPVYSMNMQREMPFINRAYAFSPTESQYLLKHSISDIIVTTISDFNGVKAGEDISSKLVYCGQVNTGAYCENITLKNFIYNHLVQDNPVLYSAVFKFLEKPANPKQQFTITFIDSQGKKFVSTSELIYWK